jgi:hypothetical protein
MSAESILAGAAETLADPSHWMKDDYNDGDSYCALGAIRKAYVEQQGFYAIFPADTQAAWILGRVVREHYPEFLGKNLDIDIPPDLFHIAAWNDDPERTHTEVVEMFEKARAYAAEKGL